MSGFNAFDISILGSVFAAQFGTPAGGAGGAVSPNANRALSAAELAKLPPWDQRQPKVNQTQEVRKIMAARSILDPDAGRWKNARAGTESDIKKLFAVHRAMDRLQTLAEAANRNGISGSERNRLNDRFQRGLKELDDYMTGMKLSRADLIKGKRHDKLETKEFRSVTGVLQGSNLTTIGPHVAIQDFANAQPFSFTITTEEGGPVEIQFDFAEMGNTVRSLDNVAAYMNGKLEQAGFDTRIRPEYRMDPNTGQYGWGLNLVRATGEELTFDDGTPAGPAPSGNLIVNGDFSQMADPDTPGMVTGDRGLWSTLNGWSATVNGAPAVSQRFNMEYRDPTDPGEGTALDTDNGNWGQDAVSQTVQTEAGKRYTLSWDSMRSPGGVAISGTSDYDVLWNGQVVATINANGDTDWRGYQLNVTGTGGQDTLTFRERGADDSFGSLIDNVRLQEAMPGSVSPPPPPPSGPGAGVDLFGGAGGFENPNLTNTWQSYTSANGWSATGASGTFGVIDGTSLNGHGSTEGSQVVELQGRDLSRTIATQAGQSYRLSFDYMNGDSGTQAEGAFQVLWNGQVVGTFNPQDTDWETEQLNVTGTGGNDTVTFRRLDTTNLNNGAWLDNITLNANPTPTGPNLVTNGSFESGSTGWTQSGVGFVNDASRASDGTGTTIMSSINNGPGWSLSTNVAGTTAGQAYALEFDYGAFGTVGMGPEAGVRAIVRDAGGNVLASRDFYDSTQQSTAPAIYQKGRIDFAATGSNVTVQFVDINSGNAITDSMMLDNVSVRAIPTPVSPPPPPPTPSVAQGTEILVNGSFNTYANQVLDYGPFSDVYQNVQGWTSTADAPANGVYDGFEVVYATGSGRTNAIDLDMDLGAQDTIAQTVQTEAGRTYDLSFTYETTPQAISNGGNSAGFEVLWNGTVIGTYSPTDTSVQTRNLQVTGTGGQDTLSFREIGNNDGYGAILSDVSLRAGAPVTGPLGGNLVSNGSFEANDIANNSFQYTNITGWTGITGSQVELQDQLVTPSAGNGQQYIELMNGGARQSITTLAGQVYQLDFASRFGNDGTAQSNAFEVWYNGSKIADVNPVQGQPWQNNTFTFTGAGGPANLEFRMKPGQENAEGAFIDAVQVRQVMGAGSAPPVNLIQNGSFEVLDSTPSWTFVDDSQLGLTTPTGWTSSAGNQTNILRSAAGNYASNGQNSIELDAEGGVDSISQSVQTVAGQVYDLRFDTRLGPTTDPSTADMEVLWNGAVVGTIRPGSQNFETMNFQVVGTGGNDTLTFRELAGQNNQKGAVIDNVSLTAAPATPPSGYGAELVTNGGFEANDIAADSFQFLNVTGWTGITGSQGELQDGSWAPQGSQVMELMNGGTRQTINTTAGKVYELNFASHRGWDGNAASHAFEVWYNGQMIADVAPQAGEDWKNNTFTFMGAGGPADLEFRMKPGQENAQGAMIDAVSVREVLPGSRPNLLRNGSFEADDVAAGTFEFLDAPLGWTASNASANEVVDSWQGTAGSVGAQYIELGSNSISQSVSTVVGQTYALTFDFMDGDNGNPSEHQFRVKVNGQVLETVDANGVTGWTGKSYSFTGTGNDTIEFERVSGGAGTGVWLDNVAVRTGAGGSAPVAVGTNVLVNGSFEGTNVANNSSADVVQAGWSTVLGTNGNRVDTLDYSGAPDGQQYAELDQAGGYRQIVNTEAGRVYTLDFDFKNNANGSLADNQFEVWWNGQKVGDYAPGTGQGWTNSQLTLVGTGGPTALEFRTKTNTAGMSNFNGAHIDGIELRAGAVPASPNWGANLVTNGSFEDYGGAGGWANNASNMANTQVAGFFGQLAGWTGNSSGGTGSGGDLVRGNSGAPIGTDGNVVVELDGVGGPNIDGLSQTVQTTAGTQYRLQFDLSRYNNVGTSTSSVEVLWNGQVIGTATPSATNGAWTTATFLVNGTGGNDTFQLREVGSQNDGGGALIDNVRLQANLGTSPPPPPPALGSNLVNNGSFEITPAPVVDGNFGIWSSIQGWNSGAGDTMEVVNPLSGGGENASDGNNFLELDSNNTTQTEIYQSIATQAGKTYQISVDHKARQSYTGSATNGIEVIWNGQVVGDISSTDWQNWTTSTFTVTASGNASQLMFREKGGNGDGFGAHMDNVKVQERLDIAAAPPASANLASRTYGNDLLIDGSFENIAAGWGSTLGATGWQSADNNMVEVWDAGMTGEHGGPGASNGQKYLELDRDMVRDEVWQDVQTQAGRTYQVDFNAFAKGNVSTTGNSVEVLWNGKVIGTVTPKADGKWDTSRFDVVGTGGMDRLSFRETAGGNNGHGPYLDNVRLREVTNAPVNDPNVAPDVLGLGSSNWDGGSRKIVDMTSARAGDEITIQVNDKRAATIRITDTMTMRDLAARLQREMGTAGTAKVVRGPKGERIDLDPKVANRVEILRSANMKKDALEDLGLFEGVARKIGTGRDSKRPTFVSGVVGGVTTRADGTDGVFRAGRGINAKPIAAIEFSTDMRINDKAEAKTATEDLEGMMRRVRLAYRRVNGDLDNLGNGGMPAPSFSPREAARLAQYQRALATIQQGPSTSLLLGGL